MTIITNSIGQKFGVITTPNGDYKLINLTKGN